MNKFAEETAIGIVTCDRQDFVIELLKSIDPSVGKIFIFNSGGPLSVDAFDKAGVTEKIYQLENAPSHPYPVGRAKNHLLRKMRHADFKYLFLVEDDVKIKNNEVFQKYIETAADTGLWAGQLSYGTHGGQKGGNVNGAGQPSVIQTVEYDNSAIDLYPQAFQAFTLYHANTLKILGYFDEFYINAAEHLDHYMKAFTEGLGSYFWYFPDIESSWEYLEDIDSDHSGSVIRKSDTWQENMQKAWAWFRRKWNFFPNQVPRTTPEKALERLNFIEEHYSRKDLLNE